MYVWWQSERLRDKRGGAKRLDLVDWHRKVLLVAVKALRQKLSALRLAPELLARF